MENNDKYFILGLVSLAVTLFLLPLALYILPAVWFGWTYHLPDFILSWSNGIQTSFGLAEKSAAWWLFGTMFIVSLLFAFLAYFTTTRVNIKPKVVYQSGENDRTKKSAKYDPRETVFLVIKIIVIVGLVFFIAEMMQWVMALTPST